MNRRLLSGAALLFSGNGVNALASTAATLLMAWRMGPEAWGVLVVILTYGAFLDMLVNVQIWQALTHFAGTAKAESNMERSEERRVGKEGGSTCRSRGSPNH